MIRIKLDIGCRYSTPVHLRPLHPTHRQFTPEASQTQAPVTPATEPECRAGVSLTSTSPLRKAQQQQKRSIHWGHKPVNYAATKVTRPQKGE